MHGCPTDAGGLLCYGANLKDEIRRYGYFIDKMLKSTEPGDIPIEEPTTHELVVNALGGFVDPEFHFGQRQRGDQIAFVLPRCMSPKH